MRPKPRIRRSFRPGLLLRRRPRLRAAILGLAALGIGLSVSSTVRRAERAEAAWGTPVPVVVLTRDLAAGDLVTSSATSSVERPATVVSPGAVRSVPTGARVRTDVHGGEMLLEHHLAPTGASPLSAQLAPDRRAVAIPAEPGTTPPLTPGDRVDLLVALAPEAAGAGPPGFTLTAGAVVLDVTQGAVTLAVPADDAPRVAVALAQGAVTLALAPPT